MTAQRTLLAVAIVLGSQHLASAQSAVGVRAYFTYGTTKFAAGDTFEAVGASSRQSGIGGGGSVTGIWRGLFADVGIAQQEMDGERVFVDAGTVYSLGIPLTIKIRPIDVAGGWRFQLGRLSPYAGAGVSVISYREQSSFAAVGDDVDERATGGLLLGGADVTVISWISVGGEIRYRKVSGVLGRGGVSQVLGDDQLGGVSASLRISVGR